MTLNVSFAELTHTGKGIDTLVCTPLGVCQVAANAIRHLGSEIDVEIFKYPQDFSSFLDRKTPHIAGFSNYMWNLNLSHEFAKKIKKNSPKTITIFGGPNYPSEPSAQEDFLRQHAAIDFYIDGEGDFAFVELYKKLEEYNFDLGKFKSDGVVVPSTGYACGDKFFHGSMMPRVMDLDDLPSPYLKGLVDKFFDEFLVPTMQTSRGCPYSLSTSMVNSRLTRQVVP